MSKSKYFYQGIPLTTYCKENNININTIMSRIFKRRKNKKYANYTEQELIDSVVKSYGTVVKYMYKGTSLTQYCLKNDIKPDVIYARIYDLKKSNPDLSNDELVILAMEHFQDPNFKYFYKGIPLKELCRQHPEIKYQTIRRYITIEKDKNPNLTIEELIDQYLEKEHKGHTKYYYLGMPLKQYCLENNLNYKNIIALIGRRKNSSEFKKLNTNEFIEAIMDYYEPFTPKYFYKGLTLRQYCIQNDMSYYSVVSFVKRKIARGSTKSIDELIDEGINTINRYGIIYYYKGVPLKDYAKENNLNVSSIRCVILKKKLISNKPLQEIVDECVSSYQKFSIKYYYKGTPLITFCRSIGLSYTTLIQKYLYNYIDNPVLSVDEAIEQIVDHYLEHPPVQTKYYVNNQSLSRFCDTNGYPYLAIYRRIKTLKAKQKQENELDTDQLVIEAIKKYEDKLQITQISNIFNQLKNQKILSETEIKAICEFLKIDLENVNDLVKMDFSYNQAINMIWFFYDFKTENGYKILTDKKLEYIFSLLKNLKNYQANIKEIELYDLIAIYKSNLFDARNEILLKLKKYISGTLFYLCRHYGIKVDETLYQDFESEIKYYLLIFIDRVVLNESGQIIKYMDLTIKGYFRTYLKKYQKESPQNALSIYADKYTNAKSKSDKERIIDYIPDSNNPFENLSDTSFSKTILEILSTLPPDDLTLIMLKYQENYNAQELANYFNSSIDDIKQKEENILSLLKNNGNMKTLIKEKKEV